jgi:hypothetical protein
MELVEHDAPEPAEQVGRIGAVAEQQGQLLGRGQQDVGRVGSAGAGGDAAAYRRCASRCVRPRPISAIGVVEIARDIDGERLQGREVERVEAAAPRRRRAADRGARRGWSTALRQLHQRRQEAGERLAGPRRGDEKRRAVRPRQPEKVELMGARRPAAAGEPGAEGLSPENSECSIPVIHHVLRVRGSSKA